MKIKLIISVFSVFQPRTFMLTSSFSIIFPNKQKMKVLGFPFSPCISDSEHIVTFNYFLIKVIVDIF